jgi:multidrug resistance efflux pump
LEKEGAMTADVMKNLDVEIDDARIKARIEEAKAAKAEAEAEKARAEAEHEKDKAKKTQAETDKTKAETDNTKNINWSEHAKTAAVVVAAGVAVVKLIKELK